jgi:hypothetical protein
MIVPGKVSVKVPLLGIATPRKAAKDFDAGLVFGPSTGKSTPFCRGGKMV